MPINQDSITQAVYDIVNTIPKGRATSYGAISKAIGFPNLSRKVGKIMSNSSSSKVPAHRVVNSQGVLSAKQAFGENNEMQKLLEQEGIEIKNDRIVNWKSVFWNPIEEIKL